MNRNSFLGLIGSTLLVFVVAFAVGRWTRPARVKSTIELPRSGPAPESVAAIAAESTRLLTAAQTAAYEQEEEEAPPPAARPTSRASRPKASPQAFSRPEATPRSPSATSTLPEAAIVASTTDTVGEASSATESTAPKIVLAKDFVAIEERQTYAAELPNKLLERGVKAKVNVVGELAEVLILSSPVFTARGQDTLIKQVCTDLKSLGFKQVHITNGGDYSMHFGL